MKRALLGATFALLVLFGQTAALSTSAVAASGEITVKVLVLDFDPVIEAQDSRTIREIYGWNDPRTLAEGYAAAVAASSHGRVRYEIVSWSTLDTFPKKVDGFQYTDSTYLDAWDNHTPHQPDETDYPAMLQDYGAVAAINSGLVDEIWIFGGPYFGGTWESAMAGPGAFFINGGVYPQVPTDHAFAIMGFNYERQVAEMLHDLCHRTENSVKHFYGGWNQTNPVTNWDRFAAVAYKTGGQAGVGDCHFPPNGRQDYDYGNTTRVKSTAEDWLDYPSLTGKQRNVSAASWRSSGDDQLDYMRWWFRHLPYQSGVNPDGRLNNWWLYAFAFVDPTGSSSDAPSAPEDAVATATSSTRIKLTWTDTSNNETGFRVSDGDNTWTTPANKETFTYSGLAPGTYKCFSVQAYNAAGESAWAPAAPPYWTCTTTPGTAPGSPSAPTNAVATATSSSRIELTWTDTSDNETGFRVSDGDNTWTTPANMEIFSYSGLAPGTYKCFSVQSYNAAGSSAWAPPAPVYWTCTTTPETTPGHPNAPENVVATATSSTRIKVTWTDTSDNETGFRVTDGDNTWITPANTKSFVQYGLNPDTYKCYRVQSYSAEGTSAWAPPDWTCTTTPGV
ncbi:fibronectin type III domain-containing protein [Acrocarpospora sp. B8E8]